MRHILSGLALCSVLVVGLAAGTPAAQAAGASAGRIVAAQSGDTSAVVEVHDRRRHHRHLRRHHRPRAGFFFEFGTRPYYPPYYHAPRYPRYAHPRPVYRLSKAHVRWCYNRYRSYRASDNTFQPYHGPRKPCISPYMRRY